MNAPSLLVLDSGGRPKPVPRAPLGPFPQPETYDHVLPFARPGRDVNFHRGQFCGIRIPGAPWVPGCEARNTDLVMTALLDRYPVAIQDQFLQQYAEDGYDHLQRSWGHAMASPDEGWAGVSFAQFIALTKRAQNRYGLFADQWIIGGGALYNCNQTLDYWRPVIDAIVDPLLAAGAIDTACVGWQLDQIFGAIPGNATIEVIAYVASKLPQRIPLYTHWMNEAMAWWKTGGEVWTDASFPHGFNVHDRWTWWLVMQPYLSGAHHQGDCDMAINNPKLYQDKMKDTLDNFQNGSMGVSARNGGAPFRLTVGECTAQKQFDGECTEDQGDLTGLILTCTTSSSGGGMGGFNNGARMPDGTAL